ncbi:hypothetical protein TUM4438_34390 [Shewanella sairae]|uniref:Uncharacterized protein n=1 Tax=Shewanella sairae TaxID=190310 RepID=A0ABQ4PNA6_9GAMM|nr:hypothetical protein [Shewanella sairae]MCL1131405.1 hypothetical protein [Shewanella sairae]GIU49865.1 hypothetical protein TUM4438_34390 [Shewanella sairae]
MSTTTISPNSKLTSLLAGKFTLFSYCLIFLLLMVISDYLFYKSSGQLKESNLLPQLPQVNQSVSTAHSGLDVLSLYSQFDQPKAEVVEVVDDKSNQIEEQSMSLELQNQQSGLLDKLYIGDAIYRLSGIVQTDKYKAALSVRYLQQAGEASANPIGKLDVAELDSTGANVAKGSQHMSLYVGGKLAHYQVESIDSKRLVLNDNGRRLWLQLFVPTRINKEAEPKAGGVLSDSQ